jgi:IclR family transcriptional regulator, pca regulon regulatory protein
MSRRAVRTPGSTARPPSAWRPTLDAPQFSSSLERGLAILRCFTPERPALGIAELSDELGMERSTTHRYAATLVALDYLEQLPSRRYRLGLRVIDLGQSVLNSTPLREHAHLDLIELSRHTKCPAGLAVLDAGHAVYIDRVRGFHLNADQANRDLRSGSRIPAHCTATGKLLLANLPEPERHERIVALKLSRHGPNTIHRKRALREELKRIRLADLAVSNEEHAPGLYEIAVPVRGENREVLAAVDITAHNQTISLDQFICEHAPHLLVTTGQISARLGYRRDDQAPANN